MAKNVRLNSINYFIIKIPSKQELQQITLNHSSILTLKTLWILSKNVLQNHILFWVIDVILASENSSRFRKNLLERKWKLIITTDDNIRDKRLQYLIKIEIAKISALSSRKIDKYDYVTGEEIAPSDQRRVIEQAKFTYSPLGKALEKETKII